MIINEFDVTQHCTIDELASGICRVRVRARTKTSCIVHSACAVFQTFIFAALQKS